tara:strand:+ start:87 stop:968 length:882 start_codon:yes stop_codon:yes gene_type:complete
MLDKIKWLHVEPSSRCNAHCPGCARNNQGFGTADNLIINDLNLERLETVVSKSPKLEHVIFCGNMGDPCASKMINQQLDIIFKRQNLSLQLHTNGSLRTEEWWSQLAKKFESRLEVWFAIDGLKDIHSFYRQGTNWDKIINNAKSFINSGGRALWQFIPFAHNEHQIKDCIKLSQNMGFAGFKFIKDARYSNNSYHYRTGKDLGIKPWSKQNETWIRKNNAYLNNIQDQKIVKTKIKKTDCVHMIFPSVFLDAQGRLHPCCMLSNTPLDDVNIAKDFLHKSWGNECLKNCGSL